MKKYILLFLIGFFLISCESVDQKIQTELTRVPEGIEKTYQGIGSVLSEVTLEKGPTEGFIFFWEIVPKIDFTADLMPNSEYWLVYSLDRSIMKRFSEMKGFYKIKMTAVAEEDINLEVKPGKYRTVPRVRVKTLNLLERIKK